MAGKKNIEKSPIARKPAVRGRPRRIAKAKLCSYEYELDGDTSDAVPKSKSLNSLKRGRN